MFRKSSGFLPFPGARGDRGHRLACTRPGCRSAGMTRGGVARREPRGRERDRSRPGWVSRAMSRVRQPAAPARPGPNPLTRQSARPDVASVSAAARSGRCGYAQGMRAGRDRPSRSALGSAERRVNKSGTKSERIIVICLPPTGCAGRVLAHRPTIAASPPRRASPSSPLALDRSRSRARRRAACRPPHAVLASVRSVLTGLAVLRLHCRRLECAGDACTSGRTVQSQDSRRLCSLHATRAPRAAGGDPRPVAAVMQRQ